MTNVDALVAELRAGLEAFDREVAWHLETEGERADLWEEIDVPVASVRALLDALESERSRADRLEKAAPIDEPHRQRFKSGVRAAIAWLHHRASHEMNDPQAKAILNSAAYNLGNALSQNRVKPAALSKEVPDNV